MKLKLSYSITEAISLLNNAAESNKKNKTATNAYKS
jgi:hypothetical protein